MKNVIILLVLALGSSVFAQTDNPFDPASCGGPLMKDERALELLGNQFEVSLVKPTIQNDKKYLEGQSRFRQKINNTYGNWFASKVGLSIINPVIKNVNGELNLHVYYREAPLSFQSNLVLASSMSCVLNKETQKFACTADQTGTGPGPYSKFEATLTDNCVRIYSVQKKNSEDREWVYLGKF